MITIILKGGDIIINQNNEFEILKEKYKYMILHFINKYKNSLLEADEINQICLISLYKSQLNFNENKNTKFSSYVYLNMKYSILNEIRTNNINCNLISLYEPYNGSKEDICLIDTIQSNSNEIEDRLMENLYKQEAKKVLTNELYEIFILKYFNGYKNKEIQELYNINVPDSLKTIKTLLIRNSKLYKQEYFKIHNLSLYSDPVKQI